MYLLGLLGNSIFNLVQSGFYYLRLSLYITNDVTFEIVFTMKVAMQLLQNIISTIVMRRISRKSGSIVY